MRVWRRSLDFLLVSLLTSHLAAHFGCHVYVVALRYDAVEAAYNLNQNQSAQDVLDYAGVWDNHTFTPSPENWRMPFYTIFLDRFVNGDPSNDDANGTAWEQDVTGTQLRNGGDIDGLADTLDYLEGMGIRGLYLAGTPMINLPWESDGYSPWDLSLLDHHFGNIQAWRAAIDQIHERGMYIVLDNTMATLSDLIGFEGYLNTSTPYSVVEHDAFWKSERTYPDFTFGNTELPKCDYPRFWGDDGFLVNDSDTQAMVGCRDSEFDQYGDVASFGEYPQWQRQISKFASVQDRLREWNSDVRAKLQHFACLEIKMLDIDGFRLDKGTQITVDALAGWAEFVRGCARSIGKTNFFITGEVVTNNAYGSVFIGRGKEPTMGVSNVSEVFSMTNETVNSSLYIRDVGKNGFDSVAFHYSFYRAMTRFLGLDGELAAPRDTPVNFVEGWNAIVQSNDLLNANTGVFDPRHMYGTANQDTFRWPGLINGTHKQGLALYINTLLLPGIPLLVWGEEQAFYVLDSTATNYLYGRQPMTSSQAWQAHGCYKLGTSKYPNFPLLSSTEGCKDDSVSLDHRDPSHPVRNILKAMFEMRQNYPVLNDGYYLQQLSNKTWDIYLPGSNGVPTETGIWSVLRSQYPDIDNISDVVWLVYQNDGNSKTYDFDCSSRAGDALIAPFEANTTVKNIFYPYEEYTLENSTFTLGFANSTASNGCLSAMNLSAWGFKAFVPKEQFIIPKPTITGFLPGHDQRLISNVTRDAQESVTFELHFSAEMNCDQFSNIISITSTTENAHNAQLNTSSISCSTVDIISPPVYAGGVPTVWIMTAELVNVSNGVHSLEINNPISTGKISTGSVDHFLIRIGQPDNPMVFQTTANYTNGILTENFTDNTLQVSHKAAGADKFRYSLNWGSSYSDWETYIGGNTTLVPQAWSGTSLQEWSGKHVILQYWSQLTGTSSHVQHSDLDPNRLELPPRRFPHLFVQGPFNEYGCDAGLVTSMKRDDSSGFWFFHLMTEWPTQVRVNVWGMNPDGKPDKTGVYGDVDGDSILDRVSPMSLEMNMINITTGPPSPYLAWKLSINDGDLRYTLVPTGSRLQQMILYILLAVIPPLLGVAAIQAYLKMFYHVKFNKIGVSPKRGIVSSSFEKLGNPSMIFSRRSSLGVDVALGKSQNHALEPDEPFQKTVLVATMEYNIEDWGIKIKIGGLGVMAQLMSSNLSHRNLVWVVPCVGDVTYPHDQDAEPIISTILGQDYIVQVQYHQVNNITYVLLDAPIFRQQTKEVPYPSEMDDIDSAIYYSAWNTCIAEIMRRFPIDIYHINDYHGALAPLHLLPRTIPCCLSLHNAEFQGLWQLRTPQEFDEVCQVYNLSPEIVRTYVQFGEVFNLLHAGASYLRIHQKGFGAVGVSKKYGKRSLARYPIFWGLKSVGSLSNPDPTDLGDWDKTHQHSQEIVVNHEFEKERSTLKLQAQEWAGLSQDETAELFVFVGRWSVQKGIDLIADVFPAILEKNSKVQLICVGPVIDLYGKFAALKLSKLMGLYPGRVYSNPEFTQLPPCVFSGADFALIPSRDEPFGLVAVEFGRKGALGVGSRVGGLGQMPGWWFTIESTTSTHLIQQFKRTIRQALSSKADVRALMRARSAIQRFPVAQWVEKIDGLHNTAMAVHNQQAQKLHTINGQSPMSSLVHLPSYWSLRTLNQGLAPSIITGDESSSSVQFSPASTAAPSKAPSIIRSSRGPSRAPSILQSSTDSPTSDVVSKAAQYSFTRKTKSGHHLNAIMSADEALDDYFTAELPLNSFVDSHVFIDQIVASDFGTEKVNSQANAFRARIPPPPPVPWMPSISRSASAYSIAAKPPSDRRVISRSSSTYSIGNKIPYSSSGPASPVADITVPTDALSISAVVAEKKDYTLQNVEPTFKDQMGYYYKRFEEKLEGLNGKTSEDSLCISKYLVNSEKAWFQKLHIAKMGKVSASTSRTTLPGLRSVEGGSYTPQSVPESPSPLNNMVTDGNEGFEQFLHDGFVAPTGIRKLIRIKIRDWPIYTILLAFGQVIAASSYQITLLTGSTGETAPKLYTVASIYLASSIVWWIVFRMFKSLYVLSLPFAFYGLAFLILGVSPFSTTLAGRAWMQNVATGLYSVASASGSFYFALNFGSEGSSPVATWSFRACLVQGFQQIYVVVLWYWGSVMNNLRNQGMGATSLVTYGKPLTAIAVPIAILLWCIGILLYLGLPDYYRQTPGQVPSFYISVYRRKVVRWFFVTVIIQNYFLSAPYGRSWEYLWSSNNAPIWTIIVLIVVFFIGLWAVFLWILGFLSTFHSWILPIFAIGLVSPRWCQLLWATSNIGQYVPWAGSPLLSTLVGRALWLWLGLLDTVQGVGFGIILLQTLTRFHIVCTLVSMQVIGSVMTILARATASDKIGPGQIFPDFSSGFGAAEKLSWFWIGLVSQLIIPIGFFMFFRKEQLSKP